MSSISSRTLDRALPSPVVPAAESSTPVRMSRAAASLFFPGCSFINYGLPLVQVNTPADAGRVDGISLLCCGKILSYEPGDAVRASFE